MQWLSGLSEEKSFRFHPKCAKLGITHLSFADDLILFVRGDQSSIDAMQKCFNLFSMASGLQANLDKSSLYFGGVNMITQNIILQQFGYSLGELPFKYLGVPLSTKKLTILQCQPFIDKIVARISSWTSKKLSTASRVRVQLVQSVLFGVQAYWSQLFLLPVKVVKAVQAYFRSYIWSGSSTITK